MATRIEKILDSENFKSSANAFVSETRERPPVLKRQNPLRPPSEAASSPHAQSAGSKNEKVPRRRIKLDSAKNVEEPTKAARKIVYESPGEEEEPADENYEEDESMDGGGDDDTGLEEFEEDDIVEEIEQAFEEQGEKEKAEKVASNKKTKKKVGRPPGTTKKGDCEMQPCFLQTLSILICSYCSAGLAKNKTVISLPNSGVNMSVTLCSR